MPEGGDACGDITFAPVAEADFEELLALRILVMRAHLERIGRFHPDRARARFKAGFQPGNMRRILCDGRSVGVVSLQPADDHLEIEHFYIHPDFQGAGVGGQVLRLLQQEAMTKELPLRLGVLKESPAARFYQRHGFRFTHAGEFDLFYEWGDPSRLADARTSG